MTPSKERLSQKSADSTTTSQFKCFYSIRLLNVSFLEFQMVLRATIYRLMYKLQYMRARGFECSNLYLTRERSDQVRDIPNLHYSLLRSLHRRSTNYILVGFRKIYDHFLKPTYRRTAKSVQGQHERFRIVSQNPDNSGHPKGHLRN